MVPAGTDLAEFLVPAGMDLAVKLLAMRGERKKTKNLTLTVFATRNMNTRTLMGPLMVLIME